VLDFHQALVERAAIAGHDRVLDVGCGNGETARAAARAASDGSVLGVDLSSRMLERARELAAVERLTNLHFERADAQVHDFAAESFDVVVSRFGAMFFADRDAAFANIARAMRRDGRFVTVAWQDVDHNEWIRTVRTALAVGRELPSPPVGGPGPLGLADPDGVRAVLTGAGLGNVHIDALNGRFWVGADAQDAFAFVRRTGIVRGLLQGLGESDRARALGALEDAVVAHDTGAGVIFGSGAWLISAEKA
jgi:SAM-dependent methyltransferase